MVCRETKDNSESKVLFSKRLKLFKYQIQIGNFY